MTEVWLYVAAALVVILVILSIVLVIMKRSDTKAKKKVMNAFKARGYIIEKEEHKSTKSARKIVDEITFFIGAALLVAGFLNDNYYVLAIGLVVMFASLFMLHAMLKAPKAEKKIVKKVDHLLKKEAVLKKKEKELQRQVDEIYKLARQLKGKEIKLNKKEAIIKKESEKPAIIVEKNVDQDLKKVLKITDDLLEKLPDHEIDKFTKTKDFELYKKVMKDIK